jgi:hypothetical protein
MAVDEPSTIDFFGINDADGSVSLGLADHLPWDDQVLEEHLRALQEKLNTYLRFIESGEINKSYPRAVGRQVRIEVLLKTIPNDVGTQFLQKARDAIGGAGIQLDWRVA